MRHSPRRFVEFLAMAIDYEREYDNRGLVPDHPEIFARGDRNAETHRAGSREARLGLCYGPSPRQTIDLFPGRNAGADAPLVMFIHGGFWRMRSPKEYSHMAAGPNAHGVTVAVAGYDLCPQVTLATIIEEMRSACLYLWREQRKRITVVGHSAGGHLAACMLATDFKTLAPDAPADLVPAAVAASGVYDLEPMLKISVNNDLHLDALQAHDCSPLTWKVPAGRILDVVVGGAESSEFLRQSRLIAEAWRQDMVETRLEEVPGANHFTVMEPLGDPDSKLTRRVVELARQVQAVAL
jgi:arylformamidase